LNGHPVFGLTSTPDKGLALYIASERLAFSAQNQSSTLE